MFHPVLKAVKVPMKLISELHEYISRVVENGDKLNVTFEVAVNGRW